MFRVKCGPLTFHRGPRVHSRAGSTRFSSSQIMTARGQIGWMDVQIYGHGLDHYVTHMKYSIYRIDPSNRLGFY